MSTPAADIPATIDLVPMLEEHITDRYLAWFRDKDITRYLETGPITRSEAIAHLRAGETEGYVMYAICVDGPHIGNLKIGPVHPWHGTCQMSIVIGEKAYQGKGYATQAIRHGIDLAFKVSAIRKIVAGIYSGNRSSIGAFAKAGFNCEAVIPEQYRSKDGILHDGVIMSIYRSYFSDCLG